MKTLNFEKILGDGLCEIAYQEVGKGRLGQKVARGLLPFEPVLDIDRNLETYIG